jgi:BirA family biotin operon repressor/biotin-[acetyl-CoA-carboxylase] ligase
MAEAVEAVTGVHALLKWPNDLVVPNPDGTDRKLAGVLAEADWHDGAVAVAVGVGVNCNWPADAPDHVVALNHLTGREVDRAALLDAFLERLAVGGDPLAAWRARSATLGRRVRVDLAEEAVTGTAVDVTDAGHLVLDVGGDRRTLAVGDVVHLRVG